MHQQSRLQGTCIISSQSLEWGVRIPSGNGQCCVLHQMLQVLPSLSSCKAVFLNGLSKSDGLLKLLRRINRFNQNSQARKQLRVEASLWIVFLKRLLGQVFWKDYSTRALGWNSASGGLRVVQEVIGEDAPGRIVSNGFTCSNFFDSESWNMAIIARFRTGFRHLETQPTTHHLSANEACQSFRTHSLHSFYELP